MNVRIECRLIYSDITDVIHEFESIGIPVQTKYRYECGCGVVVVDGREYDIDIFVNEKLSVVDGKLYISNTPLENFRDNNTEWDEM